MRSLKNILNMQELPRIFDLLDSLEREHGDKEDILAHSIGGKWTKYSVKQYRENSYLLAYAFNYQGYGKGDKAITICSNRPEWNFIDMGLALNGMVHVPVYPTLSTDEYKYIFNHSDAKIIFLGGKALYNKVLPAIEALERPIKVYLMDDDPEMDCLKNLFEIGRQHEAEVKDAIETIKNSITRDDITTIVYTSGTTGTPKGVMLSHGNLMFNAYGHVKEQAVTCKQKMLSFLPLCHIYERSMNYEYQYIGISIYYAESIGTIARDMLSCHPDGFCAVPRVIEMTYNKFEAAGRTLTGFKKKLYSEAWDFANNYDYYNHSPWYKLKRNIFDKLIYKKWRDALGGHNMIVVSGGSSINAKIVRTFNAARMEIYEGYGMTETSPVIAVNSPVQGINVAGTVGPALSGTELSFAEDGEILTRGPHVMKGYYKDPEQTAMIIDKDGWLHTGDIGCLVDGKYLKITDRKKEIFKLSAGKYVAPQVIETLLRESPYIENCMVIGENHKFASAIVVPNVDKIKEWASDNKVEIDAKDILANPKVTELLHSEIETVNKRLAPHENVKRPHYVLDEWSPTNGLMSMTLKLKRAKLHAKYKDIIGEIYKGE